jgi:uroporphyrinogen-III synthase
MHAHSHIESGSSLGSDAGKPLADRRIIVSRARNQAGSLSAELRALGAEVLEIPFIEIRPPLSFAPLDDALRGHARYDWLILTSVNGVNALTDRLSVLRIGREQLSHLHIAAIGPATRKALEQRGLRVEVMPSEYVAEAVVGSLREHVKGKRLLLVRAKVARDVIPNELRQAGAEVDVREAYETVAPESSRQRLLEALDSASERPDVITFTSSSTVRNFVDLVGAETAHSGLLDGVRLASIGPVTSQTLLELNLPVDIRAAEYTIPGLVRAIVEHFQGK